MELRYYECEVCHKVAAVMRQENIPTICCGKQMQELIPGTSDGSPEKHVPIVKVDDKNNRVVDVKLNHPMTEEHYIEWISIETKEGVQIKELQPQEEPKVTFVLSDTDQLLSALAHCNIHGLWKYNMNVQ